MLLRRFSTAATVYTAVSTLGKAINFLLVPFYTHVIPPDEFGVYSALFPFYAVMLMIFQYGMPSAIIKFYAEAKTHTEKQNFVSTLFAMQTASAFMMSLLMIALAMPISLLFIGSSNYADSIVLIAISLFVETLGFNLLWLIRSDNRLALFAFISLVSLAINIGVVLWLVPKGNYVFNLFLAQVVAVVFTFSVAFVANANLFKRYFDKNLAKKLWQFGYPLLGYGILSVLLDSLDKVLVTRFISKEAGGIYSIGYRLGMVMSILNVSFRTALLPFFAQRVESHSPQENEMLFVQIFSLYTTGLAAVFLVLSFFVRDFMTVEIFGYALFKQTYLPAATLTPIVLLAYLIAAPTEFSKAALTKSGDTKVLLTAALWSFLINLALLILVISFPPSDTVLTLQLVALATVAAYLFNLQYFYRKSRAVDTTPYPMKRFFLMVVIAVSAVALNEQWLNAESLWLRCVVCTISLGTIATIGFMPTWKSKQQKTRRD
ncbi:MAG: lipopolysaccharide biosynthesis protein [Chloroherpetonaceae bacterium]